MNMCLSLGSHNLVHYKMKVKMKVRDHDEVQEIIYQVGE